MAFGGFQERAAGQPMSEINVIPLVDVMLVLLVIFIITAPLLTHAVRVDLPRASSTVQPPASAKVELAIDAEGRLYWDGSPVAREEMARRFADAAAAKPQPELHLRADESSAYRHVAEVLAEAARAGLTRVGFVTDPRIVSPPERSDRRP